MLEQEGGVYDKWREFCQEMAILEAEVEVDYRKDDVKMSEWEDINKIKPVIYTWYSSLNNESRDGSRWYVRLG